MGWTRAAAHSLGFMDYYAETLRNEVLVLIACSAHPSAPKSQAEAEGAEPGGRGAGPGLGPGPEGPVREQGTGLSGDAQRLRGADAPTLAQMAWASGH